MATIGVARLTLKPQMLVPAVLTILFLLLFLTIYIQKDFTQSYTGSHRKGRNLKKVGELGEKIMRVKIDPRVMKIPDTRSLYCKQIVYDFNPSTSPPSKGESMKSVSIILIFSDYQFYEMKKTLESVLVSGALRMVLQILVVDDATALDYIIEHSTNYLSRIPAVKLMRTNSKEPLGVAKTRNLAAKEASGDFLVFLENSVVVSPGWLHPLIHWLVHNRLTIATPHFDLVRDPVSMFYSPLPDNTTFTITLTLSIRPFQVFSPLQQSSSNTDHSLTDLSHTNHSLVDHSHTAVYDSAALRGDVVAVDREFFLGTMGGYEEALEEFGGGQHLDLSLKAWLCGGGVKIITCSRVGVVNALDPVKTRSNYNVKLLVKKWFYGSGFSSSIFKLAREGTFNGGGDYDDDKEERFNKARALESATKPPNCKVSIMRYIKKVAVNLVRLKEGSVAYGLLKAGTNRCAHLIHTASMIKIKMDICERLVMKDPRGKRDVNRNSSNSVYERETIFQLGIGGRLMVGSKLCVTAKANAYLSVEDCRNGDDKQKFHYRSGLLINVWSRYCVMQVTDPDISLGTERQIAMIQACDSYSEKDKDFMTWIFVNL